MRAAARWLMMAMLAVARPAGAAQLLVPAYFYPNATGTNYWNDLATAAHVAPLVAILNPNSGPGASADPQYVAALAQLHAAGGKVIGYVSTNYGNRSAALVQADVDQYASLYAVDGIFVDEMSNLAADVAYYASLYSYIKGKSAAWSVVGNPGTNTLEDYLKPATRGADALVIFEDDAGNYAGFTPAAWTAGYSADHFAAIIHTQASATGMLVNLSSLGAQHVGRVFVTDDVLSNPYDTLPAYWSNEVLEVAPAITLDPQGGGAFGGAGVLMMFLGLRRLKKAPSASEKYCV